MQRFLIYAGFALLLVSVLPRTLPAQIDYSGPAWAQGIQTAVHFTPCKVTVEVVNNLYSC